MLIMLIAYTNNEKWKYKIASGGVCINLVSREFINHFFLQRVPSVWLSNKSTQKKGYETFAGRRE